MTPQGLGPGSPWLWSVLFVTALHLLTTAGTWWITDHGEILAVADRFMATGHLDLQDLGPGWENWTRIVAARGSTQTRFLPLSILLLIPFLALDHLAGWRDPASFRFVYLQGHFFAGLGLVLAGRFVTRASGSPSTAALAVLLLGLNWPVWMIARRIGPEPVLFALMTWFAAGGPRSRFACLLLLPWVHASGLLLGLGGLLCLIVQERSISARGVRIAALGWVLGGSSVALFWNLPAYGHPILGGYSDYTSDGFFALRNPLAGAVSLFLSIAWWTLPLWYVAFLEGRHAAARGLALWLPALAFFGLFSHPEPARRLAPLLGAWVVVLMTRPPALARARAATLALLSLASGGLGLGQDFVDVVSTPLGVFSGPFLLFLRMAFVEARPAQAATCVLLLLIVVYWSGSRTLRQVLSP